LIQRTCSIKECRSLFGQSVHYKNLFDKDMSMGTMQKDIRVWESRNNFTMDYSLEKLEMVE